MIKILFKKRKLIHFLFVFTVLTVLCMTSGREASAAPLQNNIGINPQLTIGENIIQESFTTGVTSVDDAGKRATQFIKGGLRLLGTIVAVICLFMGIANATQHDTAGRNMCLIGMGLGILMAFSWDIVVFIIG